MALQAIRQDTFKTDSNSALICAIIAESGRNSEPESTGKFFFLRNELISRLRYSSLPNTSNIKTWEQAVSYVETYSTSKLAGSSTPQRFSFKVPAIGLEELTEHCNLPGTPNLSNITETIGGRSFVRQRSSWSSLSEQEKLDENNIKTRFIEINKNPAADPNAAGRESASIPHDYIPVANPVFRSMPSELNLVVFVDNEKSTVDWISTISDLQRYFTINAYSREMMRDALLLLVKVHRPSDQEYFHELSIDDIANTLLSSMSSSSRRLWYINKLNSYARLPHEDIRQAMSRIEILIKKIYPDPNQSKQANNILLKAACSFVVDSLALDLLYDIKKQVQAGEEPSYQRILDDITRYELQTGNVPKTELKYNRPIGNERIQFMNTYIDSEDEKRRKLFLADVHTGNYCNPPILPTGSNPLGLQTINNTYNPVINPVPLRGPDSLRAPYSAPQNMLQNMTHLGDSFDDLSDSFQNLSHVHRSTPAPLTSPASQSAIVSPPQVDARTIDFNNSLQTTHNSTMGSPNATIIGGADQNISTRSNPPPNELQFDQFEKPFCNWDYTFPMKSKFFFPTQTGFRQIPLDKLTDAAQERCLAMTAGSKLPGATEFLETIPLEYQSATLVPPDKISHFRAKATDKMPKAIVQKLKAQAECNTLAINRQGRDPTVRNNVNRYNSNDRDIGRDRSRERRSMTPDRFTSRDSSGYRSMTRQNSRREDESYNRGRVSNDYYRPRSRERTPVGDGRNGRRNYNNQSRERFRENNGSFRYRNNSRENVATNRPRYSAENRSLSADRNRASRRYSDRPRYYDDRRSSSRDRLYNPDYYPPRSPNFIDKRAYQRHSDPPRFRSISPYAEAGNRRSKSIERLEIIKRDYPDMKPGINCRKDYDPLTTKSCRKCVTNQHHEFRCSKFQGYSDTKCTICFEGHHLDKECVMPKKYPPSVHATQVAEQISDLLSLDDLINKKLDKAMHSKNACPL